MKNKLQSLLFIACTVLISSCGTASYYSSAVFDDGIYYRPTKESRAQMVEAAREHYEMEQAAYQQSDYSTYLAKDDDGNLYLINEYEDGDSYEARLHKFDSPVYTYYADFGVWNYPWYNPWWGSYRYPYYGYAYNSWYWRYYDPWFYDPFYTWYGPSYYDPYYWGSPYYYGYYWHNNYLPGYGPGPGPGGHHSESRRDNVVYTHRTENNGGTMYRRTSSGNYGATAGRMSVTSAGTTGSIRNASGNLSTTKSSNSVRTSTTTSSGQPRSTRTVRSSSSNSGGSYSSSSVTRSSGGGSYSGGSSSGGYSGGGSSSGSSSSSSSGGGGGHRR